LAAELHDDTGQVLSTLLLQLRLFRDAAAKPDADPAALAEQAASSTELAREVLDGVRRLALELRPRMLDDLGLQAALRAYVEEWSARTGIPLRFDAALPTECALPSAAEIAIYRMVQEALANVARHAAAGRVDLRLAEEDGSLVVEVRDDGVGFAPERVTAPRTSTDGGAASTAPEARQLGRHETQPRVDGTASAAQTHNAADRELATSGLGAGLGLFSMQERIALAGGTLRIESAPGRGTLVRAVVPLTRAVPAAVAAVAGYPVAASGRR
jgi:signal transduction histidine kinase